MAIGKNKKGTFVVDWQYRRYPRATRNAAASRIDTKLAAHSVRMKWRIRGGYVSVIESKVVTDIGGQASALVCESAPARL